MNIFDRARLTTTMAKEAPDTLPLASKVCWIHRRLGNGKCRIDLRIHMLLVMNKDTIHFPILKRLYSVHDIVQMQLTYDHGCMNVHEIFKLEFRSFNFEQSPASHSHSSSYKSSILHSTAAQTAMFHAAYLAALNFLIHVDEAIHQGFYTFSTRHELPIVDIRTDLLDSTSEFDMIQVLSSPDELPAKPIYAPAPTDQIPFYVLARTAPQLRLRFVIPGYREETLSLPVDTKDMAFLLERTLAKQKWSDEHISKSVVDFLEVPLVSVQFEGEHKRVGKLPK
jgi:hypothetical protein